MKEKKNRRFLSRIIMIVTVFAAASFLMAGCGSLSSHENSAAPVSADRSTAAQNTAVTASGSGTATETQKGNYRKISYKITGSDYDEQDVADTVERIRKRVNVLYPHSYVTMSGRQAEKQNGQESESMPDTIDICLSEEYDNPGEEYIRDIVKPGVFELTGPENTLLLSNSYVIYAQTVVVNQGKSDESYSLRIGLDNSGKKILSYATEKYVGQRMSVAVDQQVYDNPVVQEPITDGVFFVQGLSSRDEAAMIAAYCAAMPLRLTLVPQT